MHLKQYHKENDNTMQIYDNIMSFFGGWILMKIL